MTLSIFPLHFQIFVSYFTFNYACESVCVGAGGYRCPQGPEEKDRFPGAPVTDSLGVFQCGAVS